MSAASCGGCTLEEVRAGRTIGDNYDAVASDVKKGYNICLQKDSIGVDTHGRGTHSPNWPYGVHPRIAVPKKSLTPDPDVAAHPQINLPDLAIREFRRR